MPKRRLELTLSEEQSPGNWTVVESDSTDYEAGKEQEAKKAFDKKKNA